MQSKKSHLKKTSWDSGNPCSCDRPRRSWSILWASRCCCWSRPKLRRCRWCPNPRLRIPNCHRPWFNFDGEDLIRFRSTKVGFLIESESRTSASFDPWNANEATRAFRQFTFDRESRPNETWVSLLRTNSYFFGFSTTPTHIITVHRLLPEQRWARFWFEAWRFHCIEDAFARM